MSSDKPTKSVFFEEGYQPQVSIEKGYQSTGTAQNGYKPATASEQATGPSNPPTSGSAESTKSD